MAVLAKRGGRARRGSWRVGKVQNAPHLLNPKESPLVEAHWDRVSS